MRSSLLFLFAGLLEIGGGYLVWLWLRDKSSFWFGVMGFVLLSFYGIIPVFQPSEHPFGRVYAAYGAVFILMSVLWGWLIDHKTPDVRDWIGMTVCLAGALIMMWPRGR